MIMESTEANGEGHNSLAVKKDLELDREDGDRDSNQNQDTQNSRDRSRDHSRDRDRRMDKGRDRERRSRGRDRSPDRGRNFSRERRDRSSRRAPAERRVYVSNIPYEYKWQELKDLFRKEVGDVTFVELFHDENDKPRGCGIIEFENPDSVTKALEKMNRFELKGRQLVVKEDFDVERDRYGRVVKGGGGGGGGGGGRRGDRDSGRSSDLEMRGGMSNSDSNKFGNTYGLSVAFLESLAIDGPLVSKVFVANLDYKVDDRKLREVFRLAGKVMNAELNRDKEGNSRGHGTVEFEHPVEAVQAISMFHNQLLYDRKMSVRMDRVSEREQSGPPKLPTGLKGIGMGLGSGGAPLVNVVSQLPSSVSSSGSANNMVGIMGAAPNPNNLLGVGNSNLGNTPMSGMNLNGMGTMGASGLGGMSGMTGSHLGMAHGFSSSVGLGLASGAVGNLGSVGAMNSSSDIQRVAGLGSLGQTLGAAAGLGRLDNSNSGVGMNTNMNNRMGSNDLGMGDYTRRPMSGNLDNFNNSGFSHQTAGSGMSDTVIVRNLPSSYTWQNLRDKFREVGEVKYADIREKGTGIIRFNSVKDAQRAINLMDRNRIDGRVIDVYLY